MEMLEEKYRLEKYLLLKTGMYVVKNWKSGVGFFTLFKNSPWYIENRL